MDPLVSIKGNLKLSFLSFLQIFASLATINAQLAWPAMLHNEPFDNIPTEGLHMSYGPISGQITIIISGTTYCLTDPAESLQPGLGPDAKWFATLEQCNPYNKYQTWETVATLNTNTPARDPVTMYPTYPYYGVNYTHVEGQGIYNQATRRSIIGVSGYLDKKSLDLRKPPFPDKRDFYGIVYLENIFKTNETVPEDAVVEIPVNRLRGALVGSGYDFRGEDENPRWVYPKVKEVLYLDDAVLNSDLKGTLNEGRDYSSCPKLPKGATNETGTAPNPSEAEYRTRTMIIPKLIELEVNGKKFHPALFGCTDNTDESFASFFPPLVEKTISRYTFRTGMAVACKKEYASRVDKAKKFYEEFPFCWEEGVLRRVPDVCKQASDAGFEAGPTSSPVSIDDIKNGPPYQGDYCSSRNYF
ncbi:hypothetical protein TWF718_001681 [Orbilia javanica]|uniref:Uncharacterized protein n=1 Tax=Orbilia javanica TaxID=47235 RepID=A0AAN8MZA3_9PEZI